MRVFFVCLLAFFLAPLTVRAFAPQIVSQAAIVMDFHTGEILFERDAWSMRAPASMTKSMTAFIVYEEIAAGRLSFDTLIPISANAAHVATSPAMQGNPVPLVQPAYTVETLLRLMMLPSSNGACVAMAEYISGSEAAFVALMNQTALEIGMFTSFVNPHGAQDAGHYTNAHSMAVLARTFIQRHPDILRITSMANMSFDGGFAQNTNFFINGSSFLQGADGFKTGTTTGAGFCLTSTAFRDGRRIIVVTMNAPDNNGRYGDSRALMEFGFAEAERRNLPTSSPASVFINGAPLISSFAPHFANGGVQLPLRGATELLGFTVTWNEILGVAEIIGLNPNTGNLSLFMAEAGGGSLMRDGFDSGVNLRNINGSLFIDANDFANVFMTNASVNLDLDLGIVIIEAAQNYIN